MPRPTGLIATTVVASAAAATVAMSGCGQQQSVHDACSLLTDSEVNQVLGASVHHTASSPNGSTSYCEFVGTSVPPGASLTLRLDTSADAPRSFEMLTSAPSPAGQQPRAVAGLGDQALWVSGAILVVLDKGERLDVTLRTASGPDMGRSEEIARPAIGRLG
jgi:hypothetical protein